MASVRISGNWKNINKMDLAGTSALDKNGRIERTLDIPEEAYMAIEQKIAQGGIEGTVYLADGKRFDFFVDR